MKVMKFGGTSVGSVESILSLKRIVEAEQEPVVVVVSALGGITDELLRTARIAVGGDEAGYTTRFEAMRARHQLMVRSVIAIDKRDELLQEVEALLGELRSIYQGVFLIRDLSAKTEAAIVSYGERLSSRIVACLISSAGWKDSRAFIKTEHKHGKHLLDSDLTARLVREAFAHDGHCTVVPGFISQDRDTGETTNLGRGGSDYTASIIAAALGASALEIWTDVDGFMTADPRVIHNAYTIPALSYVEAMELCNFGAKVIYPPTIYPVCVKNIPIWVKNTFNPENPGTVIRDHIDNDSKPIKGISSISGTTLITVSGLSMVGVIGVNRRIFTTLADHGISVFMVSQASSENSTSIVVRDEDADAAVEVLNHQFQKEIETGAMYPMQAERDLATVAIVGENMKHTPGIAGKLFGTLGRSGISVIACAQGASETNISFVVQRSLLRKSLNVLHDSFFLSEYNVLNLFVCGVGTVGGNLIEQIRAQRQELMDKHHLKLNVVGIASSRHAIFTRDGIDLDCYRQLLDQSEPSNIDRLRSEVLGMNIFNSVFVDCTASGEVAALYQDFLEHNISVIAANKSAASGPYDTYRRLKETALARGVKYRFETNVGAGLPIIGTMGDLRASGDKVLRIQAVLSGTLNFICNELAHDVPFSEAVRRAKEMGYSEPDPRVDLSGLDVLRKIVILSREAGYQLEQQDVKAQPFLPQDYFEGSLEQFWQRLPALDDSFRQRCQQLKAEGRRLRYVATMDHGETSVQLEAVDKQHPFYQLEDSNNAVMLTTERYRAFPMLIQGYGAGAGVTAAGVFANIMSIANI